MLRIYVVKRAINGEAVLLRMPLCFAAIGCNVQYYKQLQNAMFLFETKSFVRRVGVERYQRK